MSYYTANVKLYENSSGAIVASRTDVLAFNPNDTVPDATVTANSLLTSGYVTLQTGPGPAQPFSPVTLVGTPSSGHGMIFNGSNWVPDPASYPTVFAVSATFGDGATDATAAIQAQLDAANTAGGGRVYVPPGTYLITTALQIGSNTHLDLSPKATIKRNAAIDNMLINKHDGSTAGYGQASNITITGGTWDANKAGFASNVCAIATGHASNVNITRVTIKNVYGWHFIELNSTQNGVVRDCTFLDMDGSTTGKEAVQIDGAIDVTAFPWFGPYDNTMCKDILVTGNYFSNVDIGCGSHATAGSSTHSRVQVIGNRFDTCREAAVGVYAWDHVVVSGNTVNAALYGVLMTPPNDVTRYEYVISNNVIGGYAAGGDAANARGIWVAGTASATTYKRGVISGNIIDGASNSRHGITVDNAAEWVVSGNIVYGQNRSAFINFESSNVSILGNRFLTGASGAGITVGSVSNAANDSVIVGENQVDTVNCVAAQKLMIRGNIIATSLTIAGGITDSHSLQNYVAGSYVVGS